MWRHKKRKASTGSQVQGGQNEGTLTTQEHTPEAKAVKGKQLSVVSFEGRPVFIVDKADSRTVRVEL